MRLLFVTASLLLATAVNAAGLEFAGITWSGELYQFDSAGNYTLIGNSGLSRVNSAAMDANGRFIVANNSLATDTASFYEIDLDTGAATLLATYDFFDIRGLAFSATGELYAAVDAVPLGSSNGSSLEDHIYTFDLAAGTSSFEVATGYTGVQGLEFGADGMLYAYDTAGTLSGSTRAGMLAIDTTSGTVSARPGDTYFLQTLAVGPGNQMFAFGSETTQDEPALWTIDEATGDVTLVASYAGQGISNSAIRGMASLSVVPLPAAFWLFASALAGLGWMRRR